MLSYNLKEIKLADLKNLSLFFIKKEIFFFSKFFANKSFRLRLDTLIVKQNCSGNI